MADIELVIRIPEEEYKRLVYIDMFKLRGYIENGTPLPKGHGDLIDVTCLREDLKASKKISFAERMDLSCIVDHAPVVWSKDD